MRAAELANELMNAVARLDLAAVQSCLAAGADPDRVLPIDGVDPEGQPDTPLRLVVFRLSDNLLDDAALGQLIAIARELLAHGADPRPALLLAEQRYGPYDPTAAGPGMALWHLLVAARAR